ncbi:MAG: DNA helicase RecQ, partial [Bacteroidales bacterium]
MTLDITQDLNSLLKKYYGYDSFRPLQLDIIEHVLDGNDALVLMPTGGGKSICYQLPALAREGTVVVISPLLALMKDQVDALRANGIPAAALNSLQSEAEAELIKNQCIYGKLKLLYISPERVLGEIDYLLRRMPVTMFAIDEAHCISQWGHDFRTTYTELSKLKQFFPNVPMMALTATADKLTREDILQQLNLRSPRVFISSFDRPNLSLRVKKGLNKKQKLFSIVEFIERHPRQSGIIYCLSRNSTEALAAELGEYGIEAVAYHAGMAPEDREKIQSDFLNDRIEVMCATIAFGMGIDKSNVRWVIHYNMPKSLECYYQEIGRAGRDGMPGDTLLFYSLGDLVMLSKFATESGQSEINLEKLRRMQQYAEADICRRRILLSYFGETTETDCGNCDVCKNPPVRFDGTVIAQKALSAIVRTQERVGINLLIDILRGSKRFEITEKGFDQIKTFGAGADLSHAVWNAYLLQLLQLGCFEMLYKHGNVLKVTELGWKVLKGETNIELHETKEEEVKQKTTRRKATAYIAPEESLLSEEDRLFESLRMLRKRIAVEEDVPAYIVFTDKVLSELVSARPTNVHQFSAVNGVGEHKAKKYGKEFVDLIRKELNVKRQ